MKAYRVSSLPGGSFEIRPLPLPAQLRKGPASPENYRLQAAGKMPIGNYGPEPGNNFRTIVLSEGPFTGLATQPGALLSFVISGHLTLRAGDAQCELEPGDIVLTDGPSAGAAVIEVEGKGRLAQIGVPAEWPGPEAELQDTGTIIPREGDTPNLKRIYTGADGKAYFLSFSEIFPEPDGVWAAPRPILGFRMLRWEDGAMDHHPNVVNQLGIIAAGELQLEVGGEVRKECFRAGDICLTEDRTGEGHRNTGVGVTRVTTFVVPTEHLWPWPSEQ